MNKLISSAIAAASMVSTAAWAADIPVKAPRPAAAPTSPWDWAFGGALMSDYNFRGISQSNRGPSHTAYSEGRFNVNPNVQLYLASQYWAVTLPTKPTAEVDVFGGIRLSNEPFSLDFGAMYYWYPRETQVFLDPVTGGLGNPAIPGAIPFTLRNTDFWEVYGKATWDVVKDRFAVGANVYYADNWLNTGAYGLFATGTAKITLPSFRLNLGLIDEVGWYVSGEAGYYWLGTASPFFGGINLPDYATWNVGVAFTWKVATLDIRYYDTNLSQTNCFVLTGDLAGLPGGGNPVGTSKWCSPTVIAAFKVDVVASQHLK
jgi:hypothetical protein